MEIIDEYLDRLGRRNRRPGTINGYRKILRCIFAWLDEQGLETDPERIGEDDIVAFINRYHARETTLKTYVGALSSFLKKQGNRAVEDMNLLWNDTTTYNVRWIEPQDFERIIANAADPTDRIMVYLMAYGGLRRSEVADLRTADVLSDRMVVTGKGHGQGKTRVVPICSKLAAEIERYRAIRQGILGSINDPHFLVCPRKGGWVELTPIWVWRRIHRLCIEAGVDATPHSFRRYFATQVYAKMPDKDLHIIQLLLGHTSPVTTARYIRADAEGMCQAVERL